jgi:diguanylate cyclase (GGDEF)-like protein/PAS domain S-box-containing protein
VENALRESEERYALAVRGANDGLWDWNLKTDKIYYAPRWKSMLGYEEHEIGDRPDEWFNRVHPDDVDRTRMDISAHVRRRSSHFISEHRIRHKDGTYRWVLCRGMAVWDESGNAVRMAGSISDITERKVAEERLLHDALHDTLTDLANRALFVDRLTQAIHRANRNPDYRFAVLFLDLDNFKDINDTIGHAVGDHLLIKVAEILRGGIRSVDTLARFGGDEFIILLDDIKEEQGVQRVAGWIKEQFKHPIKVDQHEVFVSASVGIVFSSAEYQKGEEIIRDADIAMYVAKNQGKSRSTVFQPSMRQRVVERLALETDLRRAVGNGELRIYYQPIANINTGQLVGFEALVRWQHPDKGLLAPDEFVALAEETGMIMAIDRWVMLEACQQIQTWNQMYTPAQDLTISVNISAKHIASSELREHIAYVLEMTNLPPQNLKLEVTELSLVDHNEITIDAFTRIKEMGVQIQIDDFGVGYSSLGYLSQFPVNALKIDQSFVNDIVSDRSQRDIIHTIIDLSDRLDIEVIAEGVETQEQLAELRRLGCNLGQGFLLATPMGPDDAEILLKDITRRTGKLPSLE